MKNMNVTSMTLFLFVRYKNHCVEGDDVLIDAGKQPRRLCAWKVIFFLPQRLHLCLPLNVDSSVLRGPIISVPALILQFGWWGILCPDHFCQTTFLLLEMETQKMGSNSPRTAAWNFRLHSRDPAGILVSGSLWEERNTNEFILPKACFWITVEILLDFNSKRPNRKFVFA